MKIPMRMWGKAKAVRNPLLRLLVMLAAGFLLFVVGCVQFALHIFFQAMRPETASEARERQALEDNYCEWKKSPDGTEYWG